MDGLTEGKFLEPKFQGAKVRKTFRSREKKGRPFRSGERKFQGTRGPGANWPGSYWLIRSWERIGHGAKRRWMDRWLALSWPRADIVVFLIDIYWATNNVVSSAYSSFSLLWLRRFLGQPTFHSSLELVWKTYKTHTRARDLCVLHPSSTNNRCGDKLRTLPVITCHRTSTFCVRVDSGCIRQLNIQWPNISRPNIKTLQNWKKNWHTHNTPVSEARKRGWKCDSFGSAKNSK